MWVKALIKWLLGFFRWGQTALGPLVSEAVSSPAQPIGQSGSILNLAADVADLRAEVRALRRAIMESQPG